MKLQYLLFVFIYVAAAVTAQHTLSNLVGHETEQLVPRTPLRNFFRGSSSRSRRPQPARSQGNSPVRASNPPPNSGSSSEGSGRWLANLPGMDNLHIPSGYTSPGSDASPPRQNPNRSPSPPRHSVFSANSLSTGSKSPPSFRAGSSREGSAPSSPGPSTSSKAKGKGKAAVSKMTKTFKKLW